MYKVLQCTLRKRRCTPVIGSVQLNEADVERRSRFSSKGYERTRWLVMTAAALAAFLGFHLLDSFVVGP
jgi:hypothetical protein